MIFVHDTEGVLRVTAALVNTVVGEADTLTGVEDLDDFLRDHPMSGVRLGTVAELEAVRALRPRLRALWSAPDRNAAADLVNAILAESATRPYLSKHDELDWHLHVTEPEAPLAMRIGAEAAMGMLDLIRTNNLGRLRTCAAADCDAVLVDLSRNSSRLYCATGNCGNRANVAAYRARRRDQSSGSGVRR